MSYELAPGTLLLATHCCLCGRPLLRGMSVERGIGPDCAANYGIDDPVIESDIQAASIALDKSGMLVDFTDPHKAANVLVYRISAEPKGPHVAAMVQAIDHLGFKVLAARLRKRLLKVVDKVVKAEKVPTVTVENNGTEYLVSFKVREDFLFQAMIQALRAVPGCLYDREIKRTRIPFSSRRILWQAIKETMPKGSNVIGDVAVVTL